MLNFRSCANFVSLLWLCLFSVTCKTPVEGVRTPDYRMGILNLNTGQTAILTNTRIASFLGVNYSFSIADSMIYVATGKTLRKVPKDLSGIIDIFTTPDSLRATTRENVTLSPDNNYAVWALRSGERFGLYLLNINTLEFKAVKTIKDSNIRQPSFSQNSRKIVFATTTQVGGVATIETYDIVSSSIDTIITDANLTRTAGSRLQFPHFSSDDTRIVYMKSSVGPAKDSLITVNLFGQDKQVLDPESSHLHGIAVSIDGTRIVYARSKTLSPLASIKSDGSGFHQITNSIGSGDRNGFNISADGGKIVYWLESTQTIYVLNGDGSNQRAIARGTDGVFSNDQNLMAFTVIVE